MDNTLIVGSGYVELVAVGPGEDDYDRVPVWAARTSFLGESKGDEADFKLLRYLIAHKHDGPLEMVQYWFRLRAPVVVWWQLVRHRAFSYNLQSGRYVAFDEELYPPDVWRQQSTSNKQGSAGPLDDDMQAVLSDMFGEVAALGYEYYRQAIEMGAAKEQARLFLPAWASLYTGVVRADLRNLLHFLSLRTAPDAQAEIRAYAHAMAQFVEQHNPRTYALWRELRG